MSRRKAGLGNPIPLRLPHDWGARLDKLAIRLSVPGQLCTRTDVIRRALAIGLDELEKRK